MQGGGLGWGCYTFSDDLLNIVLSGCLRIYNQGILNQVEG